MRVARIAVAAVLVLLVQCVQAEVGKEEQLVSHRDELTITN